MVVDAIFNYAAATVSDNTEGNSSLSMRLAEPQLTQMPWAAISFAPDHHWNNALRYSVFLSPPTLPESIGIDADLGWLVFYFVLSSLA